MGLGILYLLSLGFIWGAWGFKVMIIIFGVHLFITLVSRPAYSWNVNWGSFVAKLAIIIIGIFAISAAYNNPVITAIAVGVAVILFAIDLK